MNSHEQVLRSVPSPLETAASGLNRMVCMAKGWTRARAEDWAAAAMYDSLNKLSDAQLRNRGLSRSTLAYDIVRSIDC
jgi:hypothetical protein